MRRVAFLYISLMSGFITTAGFLHLLLHSACSDLLSDLSGRTSSLMQIRSWEKLDHVSRQGSLDRI